VERRLRPTAKNYIPQNGFHTIEDHPINRLRNENKIKMKLGKEVSDL
jgi:hypothetical protein